MNDEWSTTWMASPGEPTPALGGVRNVPNEFSLKSAVTDLAGSFGATGEMYTDSIMRASNALGGVWTWMARLTPGRSDMPNWEDQTEAEKLWTATIAASMIGAAVGLISEGANLALGLTNWAKLKYPRHPYQAGETKYRLGMVPKEKVAKWGISKETGMLEMRRPSVSYRGLGIKPVPVGEPVKQAVAKAFRVGVPSVSELYSGYPITKELSALVQKTIGLQTVGQMADSLQKIMPDYPQMVSALIGIAVERAVTPIDIGNVIKEAKGLPGVFPITPTKEEIADQEVGGTKAITRSYQEERRVSDALGELFHIEVERLPRIPYKKVSEKVIIDYRNAVIQLYWLDVRDKTDVLYRYWIGLKMEGLRSDADHLREKIRDIADSDISKVFFDRVKEWRDVPMTEEGFLTRYVVKAGLLGKPLPSAKKLYHGTVARDLGGFIDTEGNLRLHPSGVPAGAEMPREPVEFTDILKGAVAFSQEQGIPEGYKTFVFEVDPNVYEIKEKVHLDKGDMVWKSDEDLIIPRGSFRILDESGNEVKSPKELAEPSKMTGKELKQKYPKISDSDLEQLIGDVPITIVPKKFAGQGKTVRGTAAGGKIVTTEEEVLHEFGHIVAGKFGTGDSPEYKRWVVLSEDYPLPLLNNQGAVVEGVTSVLSDDPEESFAEAYKRYILDLPMPGELYQFIKNFSESGPEIGLTQEEIDYLKGVGEKTGRDPLRLTSGELDDILEEFEAKMLLEGITNEADKIITSAALGASADPTAGVIEEWGTRNPWYSKNPYREQLEEMGRTKQWDRSIFKKAAQWELEQVLVDKPAFLSDGNLSNEYIWQFAKDNNLAVNYDQHGMLVVAQDAVKLQRVLDAKDQRELGLALGYIDIKDELAGADRQPLVEPPSDLISGPPAEAPPITFEEFMKEFPTDYRVGLRAQFGSSEGWAMSYEDKVGVPVYSKVVRPIIEAGKARFRDNKYYGKYISGIFKGLSSKAIDDITIYIKTKQAGELMEHLSPELTAKVDEIRALFDFGFHRFGVAPEHYIVDYLPLLSKVEQQRLDAIPVAWRGFPPGVIPFFKRIRKSVGTLIDDFSAEDLLRLYFNAGTWSEYRNKIKGADDIAKEFPEPAQNEIRKLSVYLTGGTSDFDKAFQKSTSDMIGKITGKEIATDTDVMTALVNTVYLGTIAFNPGPVARNFTQAFHNWSETPAKWMAIGNKLYFSKEGRDILTHAGIETGFAPYVQRNVEKYYGKSLAKAIINTQAKLRNVGMFLFQGVDHYDRGTEYLAEWARCNHFIDEMKKGNVDLDGFYWGIDLAGLQPTVQEMVKSLVKDKDWASLPDLIADYRQRITQYRYQREVRPQWMRTGVGKVAGQFLTWPTYAASFHGGRYKRAYEAFKGGKKKEGLYQIWKEAKWLGMVATTIYLGRKAGLRLWPWFMFLPTQLGASVQPIMDAYQAAVLKSKGYDWPATKKWADFKWSSKIYIPAGVEIGNIVRGIQTGIPLKVVGLPVYPKQKFQRGAGWPLREKPKEELAEEWLKNRKMPAEGSTKEEVFEWLKSHQ